MKKTISSLTCLTLALAAVLTGAGIANGQVYSNFNERMFTPGNPATYNQTFSAGDIQPSTTVTPGNILIMNTPTGKETVQGVSASTTVVRPEGSTIFSYILPKPYDLTNLSRQKALGVMYSGVSGIPPAPSFRMTANGRTEIGGTVAGFDVNSVTLNTTGGKWNVLMPNTDDLINDVAIGDYVVAEGELVMNAPFTIRIQ